jgi:hypothetical protein
MAGPGDPTDILLRRVERTAALLTAVGMLLAGLWPGGGLRAAASVGAGALLAGTSYWAIKRGVTSVTDAVVARGAHAARGPKAIGLFVLRYALLAGMAYVMIARLRLPPLGLLGGASAFVGAAALELLRGLGRHSGARH